jgi:hypothetical protein
VCIHRDECVCVASVSDVLCHSQKKNAKRDYVMSLQKLKNTVAHN